MLELVLQADEFNYLRCMEPSAAVNLVSHGVKRDDRFWADLGCGTGTFTIALASLLTTESTIFAVDRDAKSLESLSREHPRIIRTVHADFTEVSISFPPLDGILMANSLHFIAEKAELIRRLKSMLSHQGRILIIEYDTDIANPWVPFPVSFSALQEIASGFGMLVRKTGTHPSIYRGREMYAALISVGVEH